MLKGGLELNAEERYPRVKAFRCGDVAEAGYFGRAECGGVEAVFAGILIAYLAASFSSVLCHVSGQAPVVLGGSRCDRGVAKGIRGASHQVVQHSNTNVLSRR